MKKPFTLIEMLVVAAILAILAGLLLPALGVAKARGRKIVCVSHLKQYSIATENYLADFNGYYMDVQTYLFPESAFIRYFGNGNVMAEKIARCPDDFSTEELGKLPSWKTSEEMRIKVSIGGSASNLSDSKMMTSEGVQSAWRRVDLPYMMPYPTSKRALWMDYQAESGVGADEAMTAPPILAGAKTGYTGMNHFVFRHSGGTSNIAFMDGHVGEMRSLLPLADQGHRFAGEVSGFAKFMEFPFGPRPENIAAGRGTASESPHVSYH